MARCRPTWCQALDAFPTFSCRKGYRAWVTETLRIPAATMSPERVDEMDLGRWIDGGIRLAPRHWKRNVLKYAADSREMNSDEAAYLRCPGKFRHWVRQMNARRLLVPVEYGFRVEDGRVWLVKIAYVLPAPGNTDGELPTETPGRVMFLCQGLDRNVKTWYITDRYKHRAHYKSRDGVRVITCASEMDALLS